MALLTESRLIESAAINKCADWVDPPGGAVPAASSFPEACGFALTDDPATGDTYTMPQAARLIFIKAPYPLDRLFFLIIYAFLTFVGGSIEGLSRLVGCRSPKIQIVAVSKILLGVLYRWAGFSLRPIDAQLEQQANYTCPKEIMSLQQANTAYLGASIDYDVWVCYAAANGYEAKEAAPMVWVARSQASPLELLRQYNRGIIDEDRYDQRLREQGWIDEKEAAEWYESQKAWPPVSDIIRMMVRDVADPKVVESFQLHAEFDEKYQGRLKDYAGSEFIPESVMLDYWAAHWQNISPGHLYEMYHRLNPDVRQVAPELAVTRENVYTALGQNDVPPFWRDRLMAISYRPLTRTDTQRMYYLGKATYDEMYNSYLDEGYHPDNARLMSEFTKGLKIEYNRIHNGGLSAQQIADNYANGTIDLETAQEWMRELNIQESEIENAFSWARRRFQNQNRRLIIRAIRRRFTRGGYSKDGTEARLIDEGLDSDQADGLIRAWEGMKRNQDRNPTVAMFCKWASSGIITAQQYRDRLVDLGYTESDALRIVSMCQVEAVAKWANEQTALLEQQMAAQQKAMESYRKELEKWIKSGRKGPMPVPTPQTGSGGGQKPPPVNCIVDPCTGKSVPPGTLSFACGDPPSDVDECGNPVETNGEPAEPVAPPVNE